MRKVCFRRSNEKEQENKEKWMIKTGIEGTLWKVHDEKRGKGFKRKKTRQTKRERKKRRWLRERLSSLVWCK